MITIMNEHGHYYAPYTHTLFNEHNETIVHFSNAAEIFENLSEDDQMAVSNLVSRAYKAGRASSDILHKKKLWSCLELMSEITGRDLIANGVEEACELLKELMETKGLYFLKYTFTYSGGDVCPTIDYQVSKYTGMERDKEIK